MVSKILRKLLKELHNDFSFDFRETYKKMLNLSRKTQKSPIFLVFDMVSKRIKI